MRRLIAPWVAVFALAVGAGAAGAQSPVPGGVSTVGKILPVPNGGDVRQSNTNESGDAVAVNENGTTQSNQQSQSGTGGNASAGDATGGNGGSRGDAGAGEAEGADGGQAQEDRTPNSAGK